ncbi:PREDICTED: interleukin-1 receptor-associated kinase 4 [Poecilia mexicana]|uniref:Interleukin-1 receptor-associated kinase 4 n=1 Tax=Poecilia mexicana TaxID=48701 RepID=A0A3B3WDZ4_9TELE|nr:PREDICTED: interleukin-1 receptor-associated kinase 4-like [Poecilia mexicana]XP_014868699.1 PREDICTED: interleukin-1 receptor-associated kinase 4 [Poecilia mexicana]
MSSSLTSATYIRNISYGLRRQLSDFLDPQDRWKDVIVSIRKPSGELRYSQLHVRRFEGLVAQGKSPTVELLNDWGTTNCTVGELVDILKSRNLLAAASLLLPWEEYSSAETHLLPLPLPPDRDPPTRPLGETQSQPPPAGSAPETQVLSDNSQTGHTGVSSFMYSELRKITGNFDDRSVSNGGSRLGEGGFGTVYKGFLNNRAVAVKKLNPIDDMPLDKLQDQFNQEIQTLKVLKHENLVDMVGFSCDEQQMCIVYAFMANGSLLDRLACLDGSPPLSWRQRCLIAEGTARGLEYLHSNHHVHRDVKSANILLDENFVAKISDFGLTRASAKHTSTTMRTDRIVGTRAYMAAEALRGEITPKSDVFSFGVVLLEILSGLPPADENKEPQFLMDIRDDIDDEDEDLTLEQFLDRKMTDWELSQVESIYCLASNCLDDRKNRRPFIKQVVSEIHSVVKSISLES